VRLITWTFDPLLSANAHLNIRKLGAVSHEFKENYYGTEGDGGLSTLGNSDRLLVEWWVTHRRVKERLEGERSNLGLKQYLEAHTPILNPTSAATDGTPWPVENALYPSASMVLLEIPVDFPTIIRRDEVLARAWQEHTRSMFKLLMNKGYMVTDFVREPHEGRDRAFYLLSHRSPQFDFSLN
jgi:predicted GNAT superfamily acetyltransferase